MTALGCCGSAFGVGGDDVGLDGVAGPWFVPVVAREIVSCGVPVSYVVHEIRSRRERLGANGVCGTVAACLV